MDTWKYYDITHRRHLLCNPMSSAKLDELIQLFKLRPGGSVVDIAFGKGEVLVRLAETYDITGVGVDISPFCVADATRKRQERVPDAGLEFLQMDGADYLPEAPESFDLAMCIGASWVHQGHRGTLRALNGMTAPGGLVLVGEPFWLKEPAEEHLAAEGYTKELFGTHHGNVSTGQDEGLAPLYTAVSNQDDWDRYETLQWYAVADYAATNPDDPDLPELLARTARSRDSYLKWGRETLGWALYLFRKPAQS